MNKMNKMKKNKKKKKKNWDSYKTEYESDEHWDLRRSFMLAHQDKFPKDYLVCLAQVFTNVEFLGCRYPQETMELVAHLSQGVADEFREKQKSKLKRTFVQASDVASSKIKGRSNDMPELKRKCISTQQIKAVPVEMVLPDTSTEICVEQTPSAVPSAPECTGLHRASARDNETPASSPAAPSPSPQNSLCSTAPPVNTLDGTPVNALRLGGIPIGVYGKLVIIANDSETHIDTILRSCRACNIDHECFFERISSSLTRCTLFINRKLVATGTGLTDESSWINCGIGAMKSLKKTCYTIRVKQKFTSGSNNVMEKSGSQCDKEEAPLPANNLGSKMMGGGTGGDLSKSSQGIQEPYESCTLHITRMLVESGKKKRDRLVLEKLNNSCDTIHVKQKFRLGTNDVIEKFGTSGSNNVMESQCDEEAPLPANNLGSKMMRMMGWTGGGLGKSSQGIQEPVKAKGYARQAGGLGLKNSEWDDDKFLGCKKGPILSTMLGLFRIYRSSDTYNDLVFASDFTKDERATLHRIALWNMFKSCTYGEGLDRHLVVSKNECLWDIVTDMVISGQPNDEYDLEEPSESQRICREIGLKSKSYGKGLNRHLIVSKMVTSGSQRVRKADLCLKGSTFTGTIKRLFHDYKSRDADNDLVFARDFKKNQRAKLHQIARKMGLKSKSYGKKRNRHLVVSNSS